MPDISKEDLIKRLLFAKILNFSTAIDLMKTIGIWSGFSYMTRHLLMKSLDDNQVEDIRTAVRSGEIADVDIISLLDDLEYLEAEAGRLLLVKDEKECEKSKQEAIKLLRRLEGELEDRTPWEKFLRAIGYHKGVGRKGILKNENILNVPPKVSAYSRTRAD